MLGTYTEYVLIPGYIASVNLFSKPERLSFAEAELLEPLSCVVHGLAQLAIRPDDAVVIVGPGAMTRPEERACGFPKIKGVG